MKEKSGIRLVAPSPSPIWGRETVGLYCFKMEMMQSTTLSISSGVILPALRRMIFLSAVKIREGRINDVVGNDPEMKSVELSAGAVVSFDCWDVIWQRRMSSPRRLAITKAGRRLLPDKSEKERV